MSVDNFMGDKSSIMEAINKDNETNKTETSETTETTETTETVAETTETTEKENVLSNTETENKESQTTEETNTEGVKWDISAFNSEFKTEFATSEDIQKVFESAKEIETLRESVSEKDKLLLENKTLLDTKTDGLKLFANDDLYKVNQILINNPDLNQASVLKLASANLEDMQDMDVLKLQRQMKLKGGDFSEADVIHSIKRKYNLTADPSELEGEELKNYNADKFNMQEAAQEARSELSTMMKVEMPDKIDLLAMESESKVKAETALNDSLTAWKPKVEEVIKSLDKFTLEFDKGEDGKLEFAYDDEFKTYLGKNLTEYAARTGLDASKPESLKTLTDVIQKDFVNQKLPQMIKTFKQDLEAKFKDADYRKKHNIPPLNDAEAPNKLTGAEEKNKKANETISNNLKQGYF